MSRNASGTYSLPAGNPPITGTTITVSWASSTLNDIATEITDSLDRSGKGPMLAQFKSFAGTSGAPGMSWGDELDSGIYRVGSKSFKMQVNAVTIQTWTATLSAFPLGMSAVGTGAGAGGTFVGGTTSGAAVYGLGGAPNGIGVVAEGVGTGAGLEVRAGNALFTGTAPAKTTSVKDLVTKANIVKAWGHITTDGLGGITLDDGYNITSVAINGSNNAAITIGQDFADANYAIIATVRDTAASASMIGSGSQAAGSFVIGLTTNANVAINLSTEARGFSFLCIGRQ